MRSGNEKVVAGSFETSNNGVGHLFSGLCCRPLIFVSSRSFVQIVVSPWSTLKLEMRKLGRRGRDEKSKKRDRKSLSV